MRAGLGWATGVCAGRVARRGWFAGGCVIDTLPPSASTARRTDRVRRAAVRSGWKIRVKWTAECTGGVGVSLSNGARLRVHVQSIAMRKEMGQRGRGSERLLWHLGAVS
jgi:hypothetical protein